MLARVYKLQDARFLYEPTYFMLSKSGDISAGVQSAVRRVDCAFGT